MRTVFSQHESAFLFQILHFEYRNRFQISNFSQFYYFNITSILFFMRYKLDIVDQETKKKIIKVKET